MSVGFQSFQSKGLDKGVCQGQLRYGPSFLY